MRAKLHIGTHAKPYPSNLRSGAEAAQWFGISFVRHLVYGFVLGLVAHDWPRAATAARKA